MIGIAMVEVQHEGERAYLHQHVWMSEGYLYAPVELADWIKVTQEQQKCPLTVQSWYLKERSDIGY
ncbi:MAG TPA: hypothetical protein VEL31_17270 [Ktedonobacteraceae bacterium]|nr:hypothetical protein [Ktedonobacteraceae bacterium]